MKSDYVIDFERINQLTTSIYDDPTDKSNPFTNGKFAFSLSRKIIIDYIEKFRSLQSRDIPDDRMQHVIDTLEYNGILVSKAKIRDNKISKIISE
jgi:hypothetical protein